MQNKAQKNMVSLFGQIASQWEFDHETSGERFGRITLKICRQSGTEDLIPLMVSEKFLEIGNIQPGIFATVEGMYRSFNMWENDHSHLLLFVFVEDIFLFTSEHSMFWKNEALIDGYLCKKPVYRKTPFGREITDFLMAVNRTNGKTDYIPCICWGRNAKYVALLNIGDLVSVSGRIQSREYHKVLPDGTYVNRTAYELSARNVDRISEAV